MNEQEIDLLELWQVLNKNKRKIAYITGGFIALSCAYLMIVPPTYQSTSLLRIKQDKGLSDSILSQMPLGNTQMTQQKMNTNAEILKSRNVVIPVIKATEGLKDGKYPDYDAYVKSHITTKPFKDTEILQLDVTGGTPEKAQEVNRLLVRGFLARLADLSHEESGNTRKFLENRVVSAKTELGQAEDKLKAYQIAHKIYSTDDQMKGLADQISTLDKAKAQNQLDLETAQAALSSINGQLAGAGAAIADSPAIQKYKTSLVQLESTKAGYTGKYTDQHPKMQEINKQIAETKSNLEKEIAAIIAQQAPSSNTVQQKLLADKFANEAAVAVANGKNNAIASLESKNDEAISRLPEAQQGYIRVKRDADVAQEIYVMLSKRLEEAKVAEVMVPNEVQVIDEATLPERPIAPRKARTLALAAILGLLAGSGFVLARELLDRKIRTASDVEEQLALPVLGVVPDADGQKEEKDKPTDFWSKIKRAFKTGGVKSVRRQY